MALGDRNLVGRCGLYCGACIIYRAGKDSVELQRRVAERQGCRPEQIKCGGCQTVSVSGWDVEGEEWGKRCKIIRCLDEKGFGFCYECGVYPNCERFREIADSCFKAGEDLVKNLERIKAGKVEDWLREEGEKWKCGKCGKPITMRLAECHWCGAKLR